MRNLNTKALVIVAAICLPSMSYAQCEPKKIQWGANCSVTTLSMTADSTRDYSSDPFRDPATRLLKGVGSASLRCTKDGVLAIVSSSCDAPPDPLSQSRVRDSLPETVRNTTIPSAGELDSERLKRANQAKSIAPESALQAFNSAADRAITAIEEVEVWAQQNFLATREYVNQQSNSVLSSSKNYTDQVVKDIASNPGAGGSSKWWEPYVGQTFSRGFQHRDTFCAFNPTESVKINNASGSVTYSNTCGATRNLTLLEGANLLLYRTPIPDRCEVSYSRYDVFFVNGGSGGAFVEVFAGSGYTGLCGG